MRLAILGCRGIPCNYGGFERFAEELSVRLALKGHEVLVYCCKPYSMNKDKDYKGVRRIILPTIKNKIFEKPIYSIISLIHVLFQNVDVILMLGVSVSVFCFIPRIFGIKVLINIDGLEWKRKKWNWLIRVYLKLSEWISGFVANKVITDSRYIKEYYENKYKKETVYIAYGSDIIETKDNDVLKKYSLEPNGYFLYVGRFEPENNPLIVREAYDAIINPNIKLVMIGDAPYSDKYIKIIKKTKNTNIIFTGFVFGEKFFSLLNNAFCYIQASEIGGTHPALLEAMRAGKCVIANDIPEHREILKDSALYYRSKNELKAKLELVMNNKDIVKDKGEEAKFIAEKEYTWDKICKEYEKLLFDSLKNDI